MKQSQHKKILVAGGLGYIGSHTTVTLALAGYEPIVVDNLANSDLSVLDGLQQILGYRPVFYEQDCRDGVALDRIFATEGTIDGIINFAAHKAVGESVLQPLRYYRNNIDVLLSLLEFSDRCGLRAFVFSSSCTVYGEAEVQPVTEKSPILPATSPYGNTKQIAEEIIQDVVKAGTSYKAILLRYFNPIGAHPSAAIGELPQGVPQNLLPYVCQTAAGIRPQLSIFGRDYSTPDGTCIRDYIDINDLAKAHVAAIDHLLSPDLREEVPPCEAFNIGTGHGVSVLELVKTFEQVNNLKLRYVFADRRAGDIEQIWADPSKAAKVLRWRAETPLAETLRSAWLWQQRILQS
ncbi:UDP-glucose 4-epimerase [Porphyromonas crevioricanis JCM 15906]|uniref:UDP-glucose 4-epimerase n=1 Tax=Porphyromonas crevioricanis JCM 15906 TaxID=1305617 RepID=S4N943_9PORP|nr:UDP-glucose 4-epimerase GalE [Porphyromonas crevioricanis]GAD04416.1 UDP-glucose 4-epimerase [Porphyromonas crevioricanis JCM 15906]SJZ68583.1 UDP-glucose 4-epimerase [Porphyromonas crevioricanis]